MIKEALLHDYIIACVRRGDGVLTTTYRDGHTRLRHSALPVPAGEAR